MNCLNYSLLTIFSLLSFTSGQLSDEWITQIMDPPQNISFNCSSPIQTPPDEATPARWMFPDLTNVDLTYNDGRRMVTNEGHTLIIVNADVNDFGIYHCMMLYPLPNDTSVDWYLIKLGLNVKGPYFQDTWEKYKQGTIVGISACVGFLAVALLVWIVAAHKWIPEPGWYDEEDDTAGDNKMGVDNNAFNMSVDSQNNLNVNYVPHVDKVDVQLHHRNTTKPKEDTGALNGNVVTAASDIITEL